MIISALKSNNSGDQRSPIHKDTVKNLLDLGIEICFEESIGKGININDKTFEELGLKKYKREDCLKNGLYAVCELHGYTFNLFSHP